MPEMRACPYLPAPARPWPTPCADSSVPRAAAGEGGACAGTARTREGGGRASVNGRAVAGRDFTGPVPLQATARGRREGNVENFQVVLAFLELVFEVLQSVALLTAAASRPEKTAGPGRVATRGRGWNPTPHHSPPTTKEKAPVARGSRGRRSRRLHARRAQGFHRHRARRTVGSGS